MLRWPLLRWGWGGCGTLFKHQEVLFPSIVGLKWKLCLLGADHWMTDGCHLTVAIKAHGLHS